jgi:hypothetical protein
VHITYDTYVFIVGSVGLSSKIDKRGRETEKQPCHSESGNRGTQRRTLIARPAASCSRCSVTLGKVGTVCAAT